MKNTTGKFNAKITAVGKYLPEKIYDNKYFESIVDTTDEWIVTRTGIRERRILENGATSDLAVGAIKDMVEKFNVNLDEIDLILVATVTPDMFFPSTACLITEKLNIKNAWGFDLSAACSGFVFTLNTAIQFIENGAAKKVIVVGADKMSAITDYTDRNTCILFGDAGACVLLEPTEDKSDGIIDSVTYCDGSGSKYLYQLGGGSLNPSSYETVDKKMHYMYQDGKAVFKVAVIGMADVAEELMKRNNLSSDDVAFLVPHQANLRIIDATRARMGIDNSKVMINIDRYGNTTAATIPLCIVDYLEQGKLKKGDNLILASFGAGYTWGGIYLKWSI
jgi:3-oxoacyl-[acyl-carrier-protein] synthase III